MGILSRGLVALVSLQKKHTAKSPARKPRPGNEEAPLWLTDGVCWAWTREDDRTVVWETHRSAQRSSREPRPGGQTLWFDCWAQWATAWVSRLSFLIYKMRLLPSILIGRTERDGSCKTLDRLLGTRRELKTLPTMGPVVAVFITSGMEPSTELRRLGISQNETAPVIEVKFYLKNFISYFENNSYYFRL